MRLAVLTLTLWLPATALAQTRAITVALDPSGVEGCDASGLAEDVEGRLGREAFVPAAEAEFRVRVMATSEDEVHAMGIVVEQRGRVIGERRAELSSCEELLDRAALIVALIVDNDKV